MKRFQKGPLRWDGEERVREIRLGAEGPLWRPGGSGWDGETLTTMGAGHPTPSCPGLAELAGPAFRGAVRVWE